MSTEVADGVEVVYLSRLCEGMHQISVNVIDQAGNAAVQVTTFEVCIASDEVEEPVTGPESLWVFPAAAVAVIPVHLQWMRP